MHDGHAFLKRPVAMGASESKLVFKQGIFRLSEENDIPADDSYWARVRVTIL